MTGRIAQRRKRGANVVLGYLVPSEPNSARLRIYNPLTLEDANVLGSAAEWCALSSRVTINSITSSL